MSLTDGYCQKCQKPLLQGEWTMVKRKKLCAQCAQEAFDKEAVCRENDALKKDFFQYLLSLFPNLGFVPENWHNQVDSMLRKGWSIKNIRNTIVYCGQQNKLITEDNWSQIVRMYYNEAVAWVDNIRKQQQKNEGIELTSRVVTVPFQSASAHRDMPDYKIEDL